MNTTNIIFPIPEKKICKLSKYKRKIINTTQKSSLTVNIYIGWYKNPKIILVTFFFQENKLFISIEKQGMFLGNYQLLLLQRHWPLLFLLKRLSHILNTSIYK